MAELSPPMTEAWAKIALLFERVWAKKRGAPAVTKQHFGKPSCVIDVYLVPLGWGSGEDNHHAIMPRLTAPAAAKSATLPFHVAFLLTAGVIVPEGELMRRRSTAISLDVW